MSRLTALNQRRAVRVVALVLVAVLAGYAIAELLTIIAAMRRGETLPSGNDFALYMDRTRSWLAGTGFYLPRQLTGQPYSVALGDALYPPVVLWLLVPFTVIPAALWWGVPAVVVIASAIRVRPPLIAWPFLVFVVAHPRFLTLIAYGNPSMWVLAAVASGVVLRWPFAFAAIKPTLAPIALLGARAHSWWLAVGVLVALSIPFGLMWFDWVTVIRDATPTTDFGRDYIFGEWPVVVALVTGLWVAVRVRDEKHPPQSADVEGPAPSH